MKILGKKSKKVHITTKGVRFLDPTYFIPDIILELDLENLILVLLNTEVDEEFAKRAFEYVALTNIIKENEKIVNLMVLSTAEESKTVEYKFSNDSVFRFPVISLKDWVVKKLLKS